MILFVEYDENVKQNYSVERKRRKKCREDLLMADDVDLDSDSPSVNIKSTRIKSTYLLCF